ncbi:cyclic pyranopterin phosphate synthase [Chromatiales bacterium (ex Bugula neritina AB1)]|nr:cyclic pyranopterin phosphate synthase [Chromatiales bacterium (ex Bugula neritina AB1)]
MDRNDAPTVASDALGRNIHDLRISVTDRCNFRCVYCMPKEVFGRGYRFLQKKELLSFEEIERIVRVFARLGVRKIRLTGGEPLVRSELELLIEKIAAVDSIHDISLTTNAALLSPKRARSLRSAGLSRVNVSLDALDDETFKAVNDVGVSVQKVLDGISAAADAGFDSVKVNMVVKRGMNEHSIVPMARYFHGTGQILRFIEFMDVGNTNRWHNDAVITGAEIVDSISAELPLESIEPNYKGEVAQRWRYQDGGGEIGVISSVSQPFCGDCSRVRLSAVGKLYTCLFAANGFNLLEFIREGKSDAEIELKLRSLWSRRRDRYSETRTVESVLLPKVEMSHIGG